MISLYHNDCLKVLPTIGENSIDSIITDPPYGLGFMDKDWDKGVPGIQFWSEMLRVSKPGAFLFSFGGTRTFHRITCAIEDAGWEIRDTIMWIYSQGFPKGRGVSEDNLDLSTTLKPSWEPITIARKPLIGSVAENVAKHGTGILHTEDCRIGTERMKVTKSDGAMKSQNLAMGGGNTGRVGAGEKIGRCPTNIIHDGSREIISGKYGQVFRYFYCAKASTTERDEGLDGFEEVECGILDDDECQWRSKPKRANFHPTVKPVKLMRHLCKLATPRNGIILDPFMGSGSTGKAAIREGFSFIGIEINKDYFEIAQAAIAWVNDHYRPQLNLF